ncbi:MAG: nuclear transport factor 2 family protein [Chitinophagaceae bacterium]|nr:nuclear transport factor 2 family protein [Chitinophagaceae bacterium]
MNNAIQVVKEFLNAVQTGNQAKLGELIHPGIKWHQGGNNRFSGTKNSSEEVFNMIGGMFELTSNTLVLKNVEFIGSNKTDVACLLHFNATKEGETLNSKNIDVYTVEYEKIVEVKVFIDDSQHEDNFWGK